MSSLKGFLISILLFVAVALIMICRVVFSPLLISWEWLWDSHDRIWPEVAMDYFKDLVGRNND